MHSRKQLLWPAVCLLMAALSAFLYTELCRANADTYTVSLYRKTWSDKYNTHLTSKAAPRPEADWRSGAHDADPVTVRFDGSTLRQTAGYGPTSLQGAFAAEDVNRLMGETVLTADWPFSWGVYFTNDWSVAHAYAEVWLPDEPDGLVTATMTIYLEDSAAPAAVLSWEGAIGEPVAFGAAEI